MQMSTGLLDCFILVTFCLISVLKNSYSALVNWNAFFVIFIKCNLGFQNKREFLKLINNALSI